MSEEEIQDRGRENDRKRAREAKGVKEMRQCERNGLCVAVSQGLNWAVGKGAIACISLTAHSLIMPADS